MRLIHARYIRGLVILAALLILVTLATNHYLLVKSGEYLTPAQIFAVQSDKNALNLYGTALSNRSSDIKLYAYAQKKPDIAILGSSRVLQFRESFFTRPSYNLGLMAGSIDSLAFVADTLLPLHKPDIIIIGLDFWWFNKADETKPPMKEIGLSPEYNVTGKIENATVPVKWLQDGSVTPSGYISLLRAPNPHHIGVRGKLRNAGIAPDGSYYYTDRVTGAHKDPFKGFDETFARIDKGESQFVYGEKASRPLIDRFATLVKKLEAEGIKVIVLFPPLAPAVLQKMPEGKYAYIADLKNIFAAKKIAHYDFIDPSVLGPATDCEFIDGFHGGDVLYARMTERMARKDTVFAKYVDRRYLREAEAYAGMAMIPDKHLSTAPEVDFLKLGCTKALKTHDTL